VDQHRKIVTTQIIEDVVNKSLSDKIQIRDLINAMQSSGFGVAMVIFAFAIIIPTPPPVPSLFAIPLLFFSFQMMIGYNAPKLPNFIAKIKFKRSILEVIVKKSSPHIDKVEKILKPRMQFMIYSIFERFIGAMIFIFAIFVLIPVPFSNMIPGLGILITSFGLIGKDGLFVIIGMMVGLIGCVISIIAIFFGLEAFTFLKNILF
jgi:hypothetical protein